MLKSDRLVPITMMVIGPGGDVMRRTVPLERVPVRRVLTAEAESCAVCGADTRVCQHRRRRIHDLDETIDLICRDTACTSPQCPNPRLRYRPMGEATLALPRLEFSLDVVLEIGSMRLRDDFSFPRIHRRLRERPSPVPISPMSVQYQFRNYLSLVSCQVALKDGRLRDRLRRQGAILPIVDGIQFGSGDAVLYLVIDALSRQPLLGREIFCRSAEDLVPFLAQIKEIGVPIIAVVSDKERALVPAIEEALPGVPHQFCQLHYLKNIAKPMDDDLSSLGVEIRQTEETLRKFQRELIHKERKAEQKGEAVPDDLGVARELCEIARAVARCHGRAPLDPPALKRHEGLQKVAEAVGHARQKKGVHGQTSRSSAASSRLPPDARPWRRESPAAC